MWESQRRRVPRDVLVARRERRRRLDPEGLARSLEATGLAVMPDYRAAVRAHAPRLALIAGAEDAKFVAIARGLCADSPALPLDLIPESGHDPVLEQPAGLSRAVERALAHVTSATS
jgi:2-succinyl-6-hydroxy-2,4-cyclohexadiene-1-carboxylate synthase